MKRIVAMLPLLAILSGCAHTSQYRNTAPLPESIASLEETRLGGVKQWVLLRGKDTSKPVMLFIHGGPGGAEMSAVRRYFAPLEDDFVVVTYDQRGAGKSYSDRIPRESMTQEQFVADAHELVLKLRERFNTPKVYLVANSWGTITGTLLAQRYPELVHAYVGVSQWTDGIARERASYHLVLDWAKRTENKDAIRELEEIGPPPFTGPKAMDKVGTQKSWLLRSGGILYGRDNMGLMLDALLWSGEYSLLEKWNFMKGLMFSMETVWPEAMQVDLTRSVPELKMPVFFVSGRHDWNIPLSHVESYFQALHAPRKELVVFENSAHVPHYEEADKFVQFMREKVLAASPARMD
ncbi:MAG TPA: alpha/beta hydrolase [Pantanalinema sp.]